MPGETPDYGRLSAQATIFPVTDLGELAARLGALSRYHRSGDLVMAEDFEAGLLRWTSELAGTGASADLTVTAARSGLVAARLVAGSTGNRQAGIYHQVPFPVLSAIGMEASFWVKSSIDSFRLILYVFDGTNVTNYQVRWDDTNDRLQYLDSASAWQTIATTFGLQNGYPLFHTMKVIVQAGEGHYQTVLLDDKAHSLEGVAAPSWASPTAPALSAGVYLTGRATFNDTVIVDDVILTQNEPT